MFIRSAIALNVQELESDLILDYDQAEENLARLRFVDTVVISDIHLGSDVSRSNDVLRMLKSYSFKRLILNGDVFEDLNFKRLRKNDWKFLSYIRKLSNPKRGIEVVWVAGNHDGIAQILTHLLGIPVYDEFEWEFDGEKYLAIHGHQFDTFLNERVIISALACNFYKLFQKIDGDEQRISRWMKRRSKTWLRVSEKIATEAMEYAHSKGAQYVFCGHTHLALKQTDGLVKYFNSGCWTDKPSHYLTVDAGAGVVIREFV